MAISQALPLAARPELDHLAVDLAELAIPPSPITPGDLSPRALLRRRSVAKRSGEALEAYDALVSNADRLPDRVLELIVAISHQRLAGSILRAVASGSHASVRSGIRLIEQHHLPEASPALREVLLAPDRTLHRMAGHAAFRLAEHAVRHGFTPDRRRTLERTLAELSWGFEKHHNRQVLLGAMLLITHDATPDESQVRLRGLLTEPEWGGHGAIRSALRNSPIPELRTSAWRWLREPQIAGAALDRVSRAESAEEHESLLRLAHLVLAPARSRVLRVAANRAKPGATLGQLLPDSKQTQALSEPARVGRARLIGSFRLGSVFTRSLFEDTINDPSPSVRLSAARAMGSGVSPDSLGDAHASIARSSATSWSLVGVPSTIAPPTRPSARARLHTAAAHRGSAHSGVRRIATEEYCRINPWIVTVPASRISARRWLESDAGSFINALRSRLATPEHATGGIVLARALRVTHSIEPELIQLARSSVDPRAVATAGTALGACATEESATVLTELLGHEDDRVRANALDAQVRRSGSHADLMVADEPLHARLLEFKSEIAHRIRAGAVRALLEGGAHAEVADRYFEPKAAEELERMLTDDRPMHRLSGLWVASHVLVGNGSARLGPHWSTLADRITSLASDEEPTVRRRATRCSARVLAELRLNDHERSVA